MPVHFDCGAGALEARAEELGLLVDMLKWPSCGDSRDAVMLRIAELEGANPKDFGGFNDTNDRSSFQADLRSFIRWLGRQKGPDGKPFDLDDGPIYNPYYRSRNPRANAGPSAVEADR